MFDTPFSIYLLLPSSVFILIISFFLFAGKKNRINFIFFLIGLLQFFWTFGTYIFWKFYSFRIFHHPLLRQGVFSGRFSVYRFFFIISQSSSAKSRPRKSIFSWSYIASFLFVGYR